MSATDAQSPPRSVLFGVFLLSACVLALEVALTRIFSAVLRYHFVFLVISVAVCGLGVGGMLTHSARGRAHERAPRLGHFSLSGTAVGFGLSALAFIVLLFKLILPQFPDALWLIALLILVPFVFAGMFLAVAFRNYAGAAGTLYAYDLCGAAGAAMAIVGAMQLFGAINAYLLTTALACAVGAVSSSHRILPGVAALIPLVALVANVACNWLDLPPIPTQSPDYAKPLYRELAQGIGSKIIHSEWDAFARTDVVQDPQAGDEVLLIYTNGHVPTILLKYDAATQRYARQPVIAEVPFAWRPPERVLCIGPGAGLDLILAKAHGAKRVDGVEVNPAIPRILQMKQFRDFGGDPYHLPGVKVVVGDGRTFASRSRAQYDLIFMALTKTATTSAGLSLVEGYIYTLEAFHDYLERLSPNGQLVLVTDGLPTNIRLFTTAITALTKRGLTLGEALDRVALLRVPDHMMGSTPYEYALIVSRSPIAGAEGDRLFRTTRRAGFLEAFIPGDVEPPPFDELRKGLTLARFAAQHSDAMQQNMAADRRAQLNMMPVSDDAPFFLDLSLGVPPMLVPLLIGTIALSLGFIAALAAQGQCRGGASAVTAITLNSLYFSCLGIGFMLIEIPLMQKLILVLGHPTLSLTVVLFALLLGGGVGSALSQRMRMQSGVAICVLVALIAAGYAVQLPAWQPGVLGLPLAARIAWAATLSGVLGICLGMPFPLGLRALSQSRPDDVPAMWGVNGITSVLGSMLAAIGAKMVGFQCVFFGGAAAYALAAVLRLMIARTSTPISIAQGNTVGVDPDVNRRLRLGLRVRL